MLQVAAADYAEQHKTAECVQFALTTYTRCLHTPTNIQHGP